MDIMEGQDKSTEASKPMAALTIVDQMQTTTDSRNPTGDAKRPDDAINVGVKDHSGNRQSTLTDRQQDALNKLDLAPATLEALKTLSAVSASEGIEKLSTCDKLTASLEQIRAKKNMKLFEKLDKIRQDFSGLNHKIAKMEESIYDLREVTSNLVKSLPPNNVELHQQRQTAATSLTKSPGANNDKRRTSAAK